MQVKVFDGDTLIKEFSFNGSVDDLAARLEAVPVTLDAVDEHGTPIKVEVFVHPQWANSITSIIAKEAKEDKDEDEDEEEDDEDEERSILEDIRFPERDPFGLFPEDDPLSQPLDLLESPSREMEEDEDEDEDDENIFDESEGEYEDTFVDEEELDFLRKYGIVLATFALDEDEHPDRLLDPLDRLSEEAQEEEEA